MLRKLNRTKNTMRFWHCCICGLNLRNKVSPYFVISFFCFIFEKNICELGLYLRVTTNYRKTTAKQKKTNRQK